MSPPYALHFREFTENTQPPRRLSLRAAILAVAALSLLLWSPLLLPFAALLHR